MLGPSCGRHHAAHLPERYGLFSNILIGESMAAVMAGMGHQEYWSVRAASAARSMADATRLHVWSYVHLPLYLGIAVMGVGLARVIETSMEAPLPASKVSILALAAATIAASLVIISRTRSSRRAA